QVTVSLKIPPLPLESNFHILSRRLLRFLLKGVQQNHAIVLSERGEHAINVASIFNPYLPQICSTQLFPKFRRDNWLSSQQFQCANNLCAHSRLQTDKKLLDRLVAKIGFVENDFHDSCQVLANDLLDNFSK